MSHPQPYVFAEDPNKHVNYDYAPVSVETSNKAPDNDGQQRAPRSDLTRRRRERGWTPISLSIAALIGFALLFLCCLIAVVLLRVFADRADGFSLITDNHYTWTYGPTAILIIVLSFWRQVEYHSKALLPWSELHDGPAKAGRTILLDHISPFQLVTLYEATVWRHFSVVVAIVGFLMLKLITIASTGLLTVAPVIVGPHEVDLQFTSRMLNGTALTYEEAESYNDAGLAYTAWAILDKAYPLPQGMTNSLVYETFKSLNTTALTNSTYSADVNAFVPRVTCTQVSAKVLIDQNPFNASGVQRNWDIKVHNDSTWTCPNSTRESYYVAEIVGCDIAQRYCAPRILYPTFGRVPCNRTGGSPQDADPFLIALSDLHYNQTWNHSLADYVVGDMITPSSWSFSIPTMKTLLCQPSYTMQTARVTYDMSGTAASITAIQSTQLTNTTLQGFATMNLTSEIYIEVTSSAARDMFGNIGNDFYGYAEQRPNTVLKMMAGQIGGDYYDLLDNSSGMIKAAEDVLTAFALQVGRKDVLRPTTAALKGQQTYATQRLQMQPVSVYIMEAGFGFMILIALAMIFSRPTDVTKRNPETISAIARTLVHSTDLHSPLQQLRSYEEVDASQYLGQDRYYTEIQPATGHQMICSEQGMIKALDRHDQKQTWWSPITLSKPFLISTFCSALALIGVLEGLQHISDTSQGLGSVQGTSPFTLALYTRFLPALITLLVATMFNSLAFNTAMLAPFSSLKSRAGNIETFAKPLLAQLPPLALYHGIVQRYWTASATLIAAIIASGLTIVVSGVYTVQNFQNSTPLSMGATSAWNLSVAGNAVADTGIAAVSSLVESANLSYPAFTYGNLVFPTLALADNNASGTVSMEVPAIRAELSCTDYTDFNFSAVWNSHYNYSSMYASARIPLPLSCQRGGQYGNLSYITYTDTLALSPTLNTSYFGQFVDLHVGPFDWIRGSESGESNLMQPDNPPECPTMLFVYGYADATPLNQSAVTMKYCYQHVKAVQTNVTLSMPDMAISKDSPPIPDESTAKLVGAGVNNETGFPWRPQFNIDYGFDILNQSSDIGASTNRSIYGYPAPDDVFYSGDTLSQFYLGAFFGMTPLNVRALANKDQHEQVFTHIQEFYGRFMAQALSANMRISATSTTQLTKRDSNIILNPTTIQGSFTPTLGTPRLIQNRTPKLVLQIMLGVMFVCGVLAWVLGDLHKIVPWNPCTIAGTMVLFAGSKMCYPQPEINDKVDDNATLNVQSKRVTRFRSLKSYQERDDFIDQDGYEMRGLSPDLSRGRKDSVAESQKALLGIDGNPNLPIVDENTWNHSGARFRLGWWRDGMFMGSKLPKRMQGVRSSGSSIEGTSPQDQAQWRYGIDVLS